MTAARRGVAGTDQGGLFNEPRGRKRREPGQGLPSFEPAKARKNRGYVPFSGEVLINATSNP
jgi:hypothetical protein